MNEKLQSVIDNLDVIRQMYDKDVYLTVLDVKGVVLGYSLPDGKQPILEMGSVFEDPSGVFDDVIRKGIKKHNRLPKVVMGTAFEGDLVPIKEGGKVVGCITCTYSVEGDVQLKFRILTGRFRMW